jgi:protein involved in plasmid replication-relaxation
LEINGGDASELHFFLELDKGTETIERLAEKCVNYREYDRSGGYAEFCGLTKEDRKSRPFRVLVVCKGEQRRNNLADRLLQFHPPFSTMILIATLSDCLRDPLGEIWMTPAAYKELNQGTGTSFRLISICE